MRSILHLYLPLLLLIDSGYGQSTEKDFKKEIAKMVDAVKWPQVCEDHPWAIKAKATELANDDGNECVLTFAMGVDPDDRVSLCADMFPDDLMSHSGDDSTTTCTYRRFYSCNDGEILIKGRCFALHWKSAEYSTAIDECEKNNGHLTNFQDIQDLRWPLYLWNPTRWISDVFSVWVDKDNVMTYRRAVEINGQLGHLPGTVMKPEEKEHRFFCIQPSKKSRATYKRFCDVAKKSFGLAASFESGMCFMVSPSVYSSHALHTKGSTIDEVVKGIAHYHESCKWLSDNDYAVGPNTPGKWDAMVRARADAHWLKNSRLLLPGVLVSKEHYLYFKIADSEYHENLHNSLLWAKDRPQHDSDGGPNDALVLGLQKDSENRVVDVPSYFRGHLVCASSVAKEEVTLTNCEAKYGAGWTGALRDDGTIMCLKVFFKEVMRKPYSFVRDFCKKQGGFVAPIASAAEQRTLFDLIAKEREKEDGSDKFEGGGVYIGAMKVGDKSASGKDAEFIWEYDKTKVVYANWDGNEPDNVNHGDQAHTGTTYEECLSVYAGDYRYGKWYDQHCVTSGNPNEWRIIGGVCAKPL